MDDLSRRTFENLGVLMSLIWAEAEAHAVALPPQSYEEAQLRAFALNSACMRLQALGATMATLAQMGGDL